MSRDADRIVKYYFWNKLKTLFEDSMKRLFITMIIFFAIAYFSKIKLFVVVTYAYCNIIVLMIIAASISCAIIFTLVYNNMQLPGYRKNVYRYSIKTFLDAIKDDITIHNDVMKSFENNDGAQKFEVGRYDATRETHLRVVMLIAAYDLKDLSIDKWEEYEKILLGVKDFLFELAKGNSNMCKLLENFYSDLLQKKEPDIGVITEFE